MTETTSDNTGEPEGNRGGLFASAPKALPKAVWGTIAALWQADGALREPKIVLTRPGDRIKSWESPAMVTGTGVYGKCRLEPLSPTR